MMMKVSLAAVSLAAGAGSLWQEDLLLDYTIIVEDEQFKVHKVVMASVSDYFKAMLTGNMMESQTNEVRLEGLSAGIVSALLRFIYTGDFGSTEASPEELLECAAYLQIPAAIEECAKLLVKDINPKNCFELLSIFQKYNTENGIKQTRKYINSNIKKVMQECRPLEMSFPDFSNFMDFWRKSEWDLVATVMEWLCADLKKRKKHFIKVMSRVRFALMTPEQLESITPIKPLLDSHSACFKLLDKAEEYHGLPTHQKVLNESKQTRVRGEPVPVCYTANDESSSVFYSLHEGKSWKQHEAIEAPDLCDTWMAAYLTVNNFLIVCEGHDYSPDSSQEWHIFDPRTFEWSSMASMQVPRMNFAVVHHGKHLYALGGRIKEPGSNQEHPLTDVIEQYDFENDTWHVLPTRLPEPVEHHGAVVINGMIYVCGGYTSSPWRSTRRHDCLDLSTNTWHSKAPIPPYSHDSPNDVMYLWDEEVSYYMDRYYDIHYYSPSADQWSVWECLRDVDSDIIRGESVVKAIADRNTLFVYEFQYVEKEHSSDNNFDRFRNDYEDFDGCVKWTVGKKRERISEVRMDNYPAEGCVYAQSDWVSLAAFLTIPHSADL